MMEIPEELGMAETCKKYSVELSEYFDGELEGDSRITLEAHLEICPSCKGELGRLKSLRSALNQLAKPMPGRRSILGDLQAKLRLEGISKRDN